MGIFILLAGLAIVILLFALYCYHTCFYVPEERHEDIYAAPEGEQYQVYGQKMVEIALIMESAACETVNTTAWDGTLLSGRLYDYFPGAPVILAFHGYRSMALRDCAGAFALSQKLGFNILAVDQRSHGKSRGRTITFGIRERKDCLDWVWFVSRRYGTDRPIILSGISMGAATVLMASELDLPNNVCCIMADCPYASPVGIISKVARDRGYPEKLALPVICLGAWLFARLNIQESSAAQAVQKARIPILLIHGEDDRFVPCRMSHEIYQNCGPNAQLHTFPEAGHGLSYILDPRRYEKICVEFLWTVDQLIPSLKQSEFARNLHESEPIRPGKLTPGGIDHEEKEQH